MNEKNLKKIIISDIKNNLISYEEKEDKINENKIINYNIELNNLEEEKEELKEEINDELFTYKENLLDKLNIIKNKIIMIKNKINIINSPKLIFYTKYEYDNEILIKRIKTNYINKINVINNESFNKNDIIKLNNNKLVILDFNDKYFNSFNNYLTLSYVTNFIINKENL